MRTYAVREGMIPSAKLELFERLRADVEAMPDVEPSDAVSCHAVCRALEIRHPGAVCVDGFFHAVGHEHSWLDLGDGIIADMYPIGGVTPFMVDASSWMIPWTRIYIRKDDLLDGRRPRRAVHDGMASRLVAALKEVDLAP